MQLPQLKWLLYTYDTHAWGAMQSYKNSKAAVQKERSEITTKRTYQLKVYSLSLLDFLEQLVFLCGGAQGSEEPELCFQSSSNRFHKSLAKQMKSFERIVDHTFIVKVVRWLRRTVDTISIFKNLHIFVSMGQ
jgi:hypothetical protein